MSQAVMNAIKTKIEADQSAGTFYTLLAGQIYELEAPEGITEPYAVYTLVSILNEGTYGAVNLKDCDIQFDIFDKRSNGAATIGAVQAALFTLFDRASLSASGLDKVVTTWQSDGARFMEEDDVRITSILRAQATDF